MTTTQEEKLQQPKAWIGIDQSYSGFGLVKLDTDNDTQLMLWKFPPQESAGMRLGEIYIKLITLFTQAQDMYSEVNVAMEGYANGRAFGREKMGELGGVVKLAHATVFGTDPTILPPTSLKKFVTGKGTASKTDMVKTVNQRWSQNLKNDNIADAYGLAEYAKEQNPVL